jgi:hypothetical protein
LPREIPKQTRADYIASLELQDEGSAGIKGSLGGFTLPWIEHIDTILAWIE